MEITIKDITVGERWYPTATYPNRVYAEDWREYEGKTIVYFSVEGESVWDNLANRRRRPHDEYRRHLPAVLEYLGLPADTKARWNVKAGCKMCPCSPGFVLDRCFRTNALTPTVHNGDSAKPFNVWVTITGEEHPADYDPAAIAQQVMNLEIVEVPAS